jgi:hypothetical protein
MTGANGRTFTTPAIFNNLTAAHDTYTDEEESRTCCFAL